MTPRQSIARLLALAACLTLLAGCSQIGRQPPQVFGGMFSPSGRYYAYIYQSVFIFSYERKGGSSISRGSSTYYLQVIDTQGGNRLLERPIEPADFDCSYPRIGDMTDAHVAISCSTGKGESLSPLVFSIASGAIALTGADIRKRNPGSSMGGVGAGEFYRDERESGMFFMEGEDGRRYRLDPASGETQVAEGKFARVGNALVVDNWSGLPDGLSEQGDGRRYIERRQGASVLLRSRDDFLKPRYIVPAERDAGAPPVDGGLLVLSNTVKDSGQHKQLALLDAATLQTRWSTPLPQERGDWANRFDEEQCVRQGGDLLLANSSQLLRIDLATGAITRDIPLVD